MLCCIFLSCVMCCLQMFKVQISLLLFVISSFSFSSSFFFSSSPSLSASMGTIRRFILVSFRVANLLRKSVHVCLENRYVDTMRNSTLLPTMMTVKISNTVWLRWKKRRKKEKKKREKRERKTRKERKINRVRKKK